MNSTDTDSIIELFIRVSNRFNDIEKIPFSYGSKFLLNPSDVHTIKKIALNKNINVTNLAKLDGITKGAMSKRIKKLISKGLVFKTSSPKNENEVILNLTKEGKDVFNHYNKHLQELNSSISELYSNIPEEIIYEFKNIALKTEELFIDIYNSRNTLKD